MTGSDPGSSMGPGMTDDHPGRSTGNGLMDQGSGMGPGTMGATPLPTDQGAASSPTAVRIHVTLTDALRMEPCSIRVRVGVPVTFVVTNSGANPHEFFVGDASAQAAHDQEMLSMGSMPMHDEADGVALVPGETKELTHTFMAPGEYLAGCHVPGHYAAGMKATIAVVP